MMRKRLSSFQLPDSDADSDPDQAVERPVQRFLRAYRPYAHQMLRLSASL
jgi:hypothetical protein